MAYQKRLVPSNIWAGFNSAGIFTFNLERIIGQPCTYSPYHNFPIITTDKPIFYLEKRFVELRNEVQGSDASIGRSGFIDTENEYVGTSARVLQLEIEKDNEAEKKDKKGNTKAEHINRELKQGERISKHSYRAIRSMIIVTYAMIIFTVKVLCSISVAYVH